MEEKSKKAIKGIYMKSKPRYEILDGLRGIAAITVVIFHFFETYSWGKPAEQIVNHGYLAVDFFSFYLINLKDFITLLFFISFIVFGRNTIGVFNVKRLPCNELFHVNFFPK